MINSRSFADLPVEILADISSRLDDQSIAGWACVNKESYQNLKPQLPIRAAIKNAAEGFLNQAYASRPQTLTFLLDQLPCVHLELRATALQHFIKNLWHLPVFAVESAAEKISQQLQALPDNERLPLEQNLQQTLQTKPEKLQNAADFYAAVSAAEIIVDPTEKAHALLTADENFSWKLPAHEAYPAFLEMMRQASKLEPEALRIKIFENASWKLQNFDAAHHWAGFQLLMNQVDPLHSDDLKQQLLRQTAEPNVTNFPENHAADFFELFWIKTALVNSEEIKLKTLNFLAYWFSYSVPSSHKFEAFQGLIRQSTLFRNEAYRQSFILKLTDEFHSPTRINNDEERYQVFSMLLQETARLEHKSLRGAIILKIAQDFNYVFSEIQSYRAFKELLNKTDDICEAHEYKNILYYLVRWIAYNLPTSNKREAFEALIIKVKSIENPSEKIILLEQLSNILSDLDFVDRDWFLAFIKHELWQVVEIPPTSVRFSRLSL